MCWLESGRLVSELPHFEKYFLAVKFVTELAAKMPTHRDVRIFSIQVTLYK
jgi:hypothetical protein